MSSPIIVSSSALKDLKDKNSYFIARPNVEGLRKIKQGDVVCLSDFHEDVNVTVKGVLNINAQGVFSLPDEGKECLVTISNIVNLQRAILYCKQKYERFALFNGIIIFQVEIK